MRIDNSLIRYGGLTAAEQIADGEKDAAKKAVNQGGQTFESVLQRSIQKDTLVFSKHAEQRLQQRDIALSAEDFEKLDQAVRRAEQKGVRNTLVLMDKRAFIVNIQSSTVITAMGEKDIKDNVFTQIDGAVIA